MNIARFFVAAAVLAFGAFCVSAQQAGNVPAGKLAIIYADAFLDTKTGIARFNALNNTLNREFQPRRAELQNLQTKIATIQKEIEEMPSNADPNTVRVKREQYETADSDLRRKKEDAEIAYMKRRSEIFMPLQLDVGKALEAFAKARGITAVVDASNVSFVFVDPSIDITRAFIDDFNSKNP